MRVFRKVVLPILWLAIFSMIAVSLSVIAFGGDAETPGSGVRPTGKIPASNASVDRATVENTLEIVGTITADPAVPAKASHDGVINHFFVPVGAKVNAGDPLFQIKSEEAGGDAGGDEKDTPKPRIRYHNVLAAKAGKLSGVGKELGDTVAKGDVVATLARDSFRAIGSVSPLDQYRLLKLPKSATVTINGGPAPFTCRGLSIGGSAPAAAATEDQDQFMDESERSESGGGGDASGTAIGCRVPDDIRVFDGLSMMMSIDAGTAKDVLVVPVTAVRGLIDSGSVWVLQDDEPVERKVQLGLTDGKIVEVTKGLNEGEDILEFVPGGRSDALRGQAGAEMGR